MDLEPGADIILGDRQHIHHPTSHSSVIKRTFLNVLRRRGEQENLTPAQIYNQAASEYNLLNNI